MKAEKIINKQAKELLAKGNLPTAVGVTTVLGVVVMTCIYLSAMLTDALNLIFETMEITVIADSLPLYYALFAFFTIGVLVLALPVFLGAVRFYYTMAKNESAGFYEVFHYMARGRYVSTLKSMLRIALSHFWQAVICFLPGILIFITASAEAAEKDKLDFYNILWYAVSYAMILGGIYFFSFVNAGKFLTMYLIVDIDNIPAKNALWISEQFMRGYEKSVHRILLRYLPFLVLCLAVIPLLFVIPYVMTSYAVSAKWIIKLQSKQNEDE
ncbi:MAG: hypothetical protein IJA62_04330 [Ruminococcus sp.]|nr:hypothetical protein [Ruminococcus sp.]